jgi:hypothetical protein
MGGGMEVGRERERKGEREEGRERERKGVRERKGERETMLGWMTYHMVRYIGN